MGISNEQIKLLKDLLSSKDISRISYQLIHAAFHELLIEMYNPETDSNTKQSLIDFIRSVMIENHDNISSFIIRELYGDTEIVNGLREQLANKIIYDYNDDTAEIAADLLECYDIRLNPNTIDNFEEVCSKTHNPGLKASLELIIQKYS